MTSSIPPIAFGRRLWQFGLLLAALSATVHLLAPRVRASDIGFVLNLAVTVLGLFLAVIGTGRRSLQLVPIVLTSLGLPLLGVGLLSAGHDIQRYSALIAERTAEYETSLVQVPRVHAKWSRSPNPIIREEVARRYRPSMQALHADYQRSRRSLQVRRQEAYWALAVLTAITLTFVLALLAFAQAFRQSRQA